MEKALEAKHGGRDPLYEAMNLVRCGLLRLFDLQYLDWCCLKPGTSQVTIERFAEPARLAPLFVDDDTVQARRRANTRA